MKYERILRAIANECWAILPSKLEEIIGVLKCRMTGIDLPPEAVIRREAARRQPQQNGAVGVLPLFGAISHRAGAMESSIGTSAEAFGQAFDSLMDNPQVKSVILDIDSPGGSVSGIQELSDKIRSRRGEKKVVAVANAGAFSAAYWIATAASEVVITPSGSVGSVGVLAAHHDKSGFDEKEGIKVTYIHAGEFKTEANPHEPLEDEARSEIQRHVDRHYNMFVSGLAANRGTTEARVRHTFGGGRIVGAKDAVSRGMADRVATLEIIIQELAGRPQRSLMAAQLRRQMDAAKIPVPLMATAKPKWAVPRKRF